MKSRLLAVLLGLGVLVTTTPLSAHHSTTMYNMANPSTVTGTVKRFEWTNPHAYIYLEVKGDDGKVVEWEGEMMSLNHLKSYGWTRDTVKEFDSTTCTFFPPIAIFSDPTFSVMIEFPRCASRETNL